ncbi:MAG TPA: hypothetical protein VKQ72_15370, partial [Aggregatilineales bacterium]|nr:hypothetical protein [Aggregatilineales bacterium]
LHVGPDKRLYVAKAASCDSCVETDPRRAALLSFALDGSDPRIVARGLRDSYDFTWLPVDMGGGLIIGDDTGSTTPAKLNLMEKGQLSGNSGNPPDFGWPGCDAQGKEIPIHDVPTGNQSAPKDCSKVVRPIATFDPDSHPMGMAFYNSDAFSPLKNNLLVALGGSWNAPYTSGYSIVRVPFNAQGMAGIPAPLIPDLSGGFNTISDASLYMISFYPDHPTGIVVDAQGGIYISVSEGRIYRFRPRP